MSALLCIDVSYVLFYRYNALRRWYKHAHHEEMPDEYVTSDVFRDQFVRRLRTTMHDLVKKHRPTHLLFAYDGRANWRKAVCPAYKGTRAHASVTMDAFQFGMEWVRTHGTAAIVADVTAMRRKPVPPVPVVAHLLHDQLEADDVVHAAVRMHAEAHPDGQRVIIASDRDYLPLYELPHVRLIDLRAKEIPLPSPLTSGGEMLVFKALRGDKSDNLPAALKPCGPARAQALAADPGALNAALDRDPAARERYALNLQMMDNRLVPAPLAAWVRTALLEELFAS
jgi:5'-3' exonuclease